MQRQIKNKVRELKLMACMVPADTSNEQIQALKIHFGVKTLKELYQCLDNEINTGIFAALKKVS